ncbi:DNA-binding protein [Enterobacter hormaechei]|nr:DNA-binding protein [Enterobacter hormaechei]
MPNQIPLDPQLPKLFDDTPNEKRSKAQLDAWWDHPFAVTNPDGSIDVRCLNGGAWDRSTWFGRVATYDEACELAERRQSEWVKIRAQPIFHMSFEPPYQAIRMAQRPDQPEATVVGSFDTMEELTAFLEQFK